VEKFDLIIMGGGIAGLSSALTAVRSGMRVALVEKEAYLGGIARDCFHTHICGLFKNDDTNPFTIANPGLCSEIFNFMLDLYGNQCLVKMGKVETLAFIQRDLWHYFHQQITLDNFCLFEKSHSTNIVSGNGKIQKITIASPKNIDLIAPAFIDATGGENLPGPAAKEDAPKENTQLGGYCMLLKGEPNKEFSLLVPYTAHKIVKQYHLDAYLRFVTITHNRLSKTHTLKFSVKNSEDMEKCSFIFQKLNENINALAKLTPLASSGKVHLRSNRQGPQTGTHPENEETAVKSYWPKETWNIDAGTQYEYSDHPFCIPVSALKDARFENLFLAGKSIRVPDSIQASTRVMGICMATGEQAVIAASNYLKENAWK
jgi:hypothetical protein